MKLRILLTVGLLGGVLLVGAMGCSPTTPDDDDAPLPEGLSAPSQADMQVLQQAGERYLALRATQSALASRIALVQELSTATPGVVSAGLANDNYTIVVVFEDGSRSAINTMDGFGGSEAYDPQPMQDKLASASKSVRAEKTDSADASTIVSLAAANPAAGDLLHTPTSRKILFMSAASEELGGADLDVFESIETKLVIEHEWDPDDIVIKSNEAADDYATLRFGDFFNLDAYGVIVIVAQGLYMDVTRQIIPPDEPGEDEEIVELPGDSDPFNFGFKEIRQAAASGRRPRFFIQVAAAGPLVREVTKQPGDGGSDTDPFNFGFKPIVPLAKIDGVDVKLETARGRLLIVSHVHPVAGTVRPYYYMRDDLWKEHLSQLPNSLVYLATPNGYADPDYTWPELSEDPEAPDSDPFNFGFKRIHAASTLRPRATGAALVFEGSGAGSLLAWTGAADKQSALDAIGLIGLMAARNESDRETWNSGLLERTADRPGLPSRTGVPPPGDDGGPFNFGFKAIRSGLLIAADDTADADAYAQLALHTKQANAYLYLPTWIEATILKPIPEGMTQVRFSLQYTDEEMPAPDPDTFTGDEEDTYTFEGLIPGREVTLTAEALAGGALLSEYTRTFELRSGGNPVEVYFTRELSVTLSGSPDTSGDWGNRQDPENPHSIYCDGGSIYVYKNGTKLSPNYIRLTDRWSSYKYPSMRVISHDGVNSFSGRNPAYPGDTITIEFLPDPNEGGLATIGPIFVHYWNDSTHEVVAMGVLSGREGDEGISATVTLGE